MRYGTFFSKVSEQFSQTQNSLLFQTPLNFILKDDFEKNIVTDYFATTYVLNDTYNIYKVYQVN